MSVKANLIASYANQIYSSLIGILILPVYIDYMGAEAYGLIGFFTMLTAWFTLLDMGLTPTVMRESARFRGGSCCSENYALLVRSFSLLFLCVACCIFVGVWFSSSTLAQNWLNVATLPLDDVAFCIVVMGAIIALRWLGGLFRGVINGAEKIVLLSFLNSGFATLRFVVVLPVIMFISADPVTYFSFQLIAAVLEFLVLFLCANSIMPKADGRAWYVGRLSFQPIKASIKFSLSIAFTSIVWVLVTQTDKLVLSNLMSLGDYGYYSLAVLAASGILVLSGPIASVLMPRLANLEAKGDHEGFIAMYRGATQFAAIVSGVLTFLIFFFADELLWVWTGNPDVVANSADILRIYGLGNGVLVVAAFPYYMQFAKGDVKMHLYGNMLFLAVLLPLVIWATKEYGAMGAAWVWFVSNFVLFLFWLPWVHMRFFQDLNLSWFTVDTSLILAAVGASLYFLSLIDFETSNRLVLFLGLAVMAFCALIVGGIASSNVRAALRRWKARGEIVSAR
ncbi:MULTISPECIES: lipopolysaccharide biosynthesis protein [unclassified Marinobacterium]|uniref:lipopolysaccharide biosynthesis protein n=1 Tax=unclassified Marinobacterium TaxID=2644139 RepID=UPI0015680E54|nr:MULTISPECIES: oligosaccharide flippase family protein [unclassified Marinobacterium]NRP53633.1 Polysaccharide biosynthesis protein [Marinobacterium sp. xm-v-242]NRP77883.1 Polysaccharide biosynthesis protein [Marinobacterium sp. xm-m-383]